MTKPICDAKVVNKFRRVMDTGKKKGDGVKMLIRGLNVDIDYSVISSEMTSTST